MIRRTIRALAPFATTLAGILTVAAWVGTPGAALAQTDEERAQAREQFGLGVQRYEAADYNGALEAFQEAYRLAPHPMVRVNMANCYEHLERPLEALFHFERFLAEAESPTRQQRREVQAAVQRLNGMLGEIRLAIAPDGASVVIDNAETRRAPILEPVRLVAGTHHLTVRMEGFRTQNQEVTVIGGESQRVSIRLERGTDDPPVVASTETGEGEDEDPDAEPSDTQEEPGSGLASSIGETTGEGDTEPEEIPSGSGGGFELRITTPVIIAGSLTAAFTIAAVITGVLALSANDSFESAVVRSNDPGLSPAERAQARQDGLGAADTANTTSILTDVFTIGAIAGLGATVFFVIIEGMDGGSEDSMAENGVELRAAPSFGPDHGGVALTGRF
jgi:hypothetical protein